MERSFRRWLILGGVVALAVPLASCGDEDEGTAPGDAAGRLPVVANFYLHTGLECG